MIVLYNHFGEQILDSKKLFKLKNSVGTRTNEFKLAMYMFRLDSRRMVSQYQISEIYERDSKMW